MLVERIARAPEIRAAIASHGAGLITDIGVRLTIITEEFDDALERVVRPRDPGRLNLDGRSPSGRYGMRRYLRLDSPDRRARPLSRLRPSRGPRGRDIACTDLRRGARRPRSLLGDQSGAEDHEQDLAVRGRRVIQRHT